MRTPTAVLFSFLLAADYMAGLGLLRMDPALGLYFDNGKKKFVDLISGYERPEHYVLSCLPTGFAALVSATDDR